MSILTQPWHLFRSIWLGIAAPRLSGGSLQSFSLVCDTDLKHSESNVEILHQASVPLVGLLHEGNQDVLLAGLLRIIIGNLDPILWVGPETACKGGA